MEKTTLNGIDKNGLTKEEISDLVFSPESELSQSELEVRNSYLDGLKEKDSSDLSPDESLHLDHHRRQLKAKRRRESMVKKDEKNTPQNNETEDVEENEVITEKNIKTKNSFDINIVTKKPKNYLKLVKDNLRSSENTTMVALPFSSYSAHMLGMSTKEIEDYSQSDGSKYDNLLAKYRTIFNKIKTTNIMEDLTFTQWTQMTLGIELDILSFGMFKETYPDKNTFKFNCRGIENIDNRRRNEKLKQEIELAEEEGIAHGEFPVEVVNDDLLLLPEDREGVEKVKEKINTAFEQKTLEETIDKSIATKAYQEKLEDSGFIVDFKLPTLADILAVTKDFSDKFYENNAFGVEMCQYVDAMYVPDGNGGYYEETEKKSIVELINLLKDADTKKVIDRVKKLTEDKSIVFGFENVRCPECGLMITERRLLSIDNILFTVHLQMINE